MEIIHAIILGIVQGLTEFLPVSSSGHLAIVNAILDTSFSANHYVLMNIVLHGATATSIIYVFRKDIFKLFWGLFSKERDQIDFSFKIILSMIPAGIVGIFLEDTIKEIFAGKNKYISDILGQNYILYLVGGMLFVTAGLLLLADRSKPTQKNVTFLGSIIIGISQAIAILPGISRSGATIATSVLLGTDKEKSARFSFLMSVPLILGIMSKEIYSLNISPSNGFDYFDLLIGFITAFIVGLFACKWMISLVKNSQLKYFAYYCIFVASNIIILQYINA